MHLADTKTVRELRAVKKVIHINDGPPTYLVMPKHAPVTAATDTLPRAAHPTLKTQ